MKCLKALQTSDRTLKAQSECLQSALKVPY